MTDTAPICGCGLPQSRNPHPDAGKPNAAGVAVGYTWECIPCLVKTRNRVGVKWRAEQAENARLRAALEAIAAGRCEGHSHHPVDSPTCPYRMPTAYARAALAGAEVTAPTTDVRDSRGGRA